MSEYWKSTPRYWCKHCAVYIRDTKLERANHEATARHQGNLKRSLRDLHRGHERQEREKDRAKQEIERLNGVVPGSDSTGAATASGSGVGKHGASSSSKPATVAPTQASLQKQREQLAELGISMPDAVRPEMAMPGEWTVTNTRIIEKKLADGEARVETVATGVRKREVTEDEKEAEDAIQDLFKKPRRWGRDSKTMPAEEDKELDALLSGPLSSVKRETNSEEKQPVKKEEESEYTGIKKEEEEEAQASLVKTEPDDGITGITSQVEENDSTPAVVFKRRKPKGLRSK